MSPEKIEEKVLKNSNYIEGDKVWKQSTDKKLDGILHELKDMNKNIEKNITTSYLNDQRFKNIEESIDLNKEEIYSLKSQTSWLASVKWIGLNILGGLGGIVGVILAIYQLL